MKRLVIVAGLFFVFVLTACGAVDPRKEADAYQTRSQADQQAANNEQQRQFNADQHSYDMQFNQIILTIKQQTMNAWIFAKRLMIWSLGIWGSLAIAATLASLAIGFGIASVGKGRAVAQAEAFKAQQMLPDPVTGLFPLLRHVHGSKFAMHNPNTGSVLMLDENNPADARLIHALQITQATYLEAKYVANSKDPAGAAMINPPVLSSHTKEITIGSEISPVEDER